MGTGDFKQKGFLCTSCSAARNPIVTVLSFCRGLLLGEEPHVIQISGPKLMCLWRTELGFLDTRYSNDYGETWEDLDLQPMTYNFHQKQQKVQCPSLSSTAVSSGGVFYVLNYFSN